MTSNPKTTQKQSISKYTSYTWLVFWGIMVIYAILIIPTVGRLGIGWDEATDLAIAQTYNSPKGILLGNNWDPSQTRLPMFTVAMVFRLLGKSDLLIARFTTVFVGALILLGIFVYGRDRYTSETGLLAAGILAINPFFLSFARLAFTESDMYLACSIVWLLVVFSRFQKIPSLGCAVLSGVILSFAIASKATALVIIPAVCISFVLDRVFPVGANEIQKVNNLDFIRPRSIWLWCWWAAAAILAGILAGIHIDVVPRPRIFHLINYGLVFLSWVVMIIWAIRHRNYTTNSIALSAYVACISLLTFVIFPPEHLGNSGIIRALFMRANSEMTFAPVFMLELAGLHISSILLKSTPILGFGLLAGLIIATVQWHRRELILPLLICIIYLCTILTLPLGQTFYTVPLLPILSLLTADQLYRLWLKQRKIFLVLLTIGLAWWGVEIKQCYPDYHLNGYQWVGERPLFGRSSMGYRSIVFLPLDGTQQVMEWLNINAESGQKVQLYVGPPFIVDALAPEPAYEISDGAFDGLDINPDYVAIQIGSTLWLGTGKDSPQGGIFSYPMDMDVLQKNYTKVYSVKRAFDLEVASVWKRKQSEIK